ncbi:MAG: EAL domain-containing protein [Gammaproteobacteria bacterium]|jgi:diguanylate cyclase|nr:EAL domain-containing protein [Gammaproteobacteria bacterium]MBT4492430.1 EAL domain-containing protein [Gammaproteobacteria bacterium]MBT7369370.1 EAL domain-containing protein [Gammaproteobacteria bacterium]
MGLNLVEEIQRAISSRAQMEADLRRGLTNGEVHVFYQPKVNSLMGQVVGMEALARWIGADGMISPDEFIPLAEESDLIDELGSYVLHQACEHSVGWLRKGFPELQTAVNLSVMQLANPSLPKEIESILHETGMPARLLCLEITEGVMMIDPDVTIEVLNELKSLGCEIAADDFGTGYSSLSYLQKFPIDILKLDQSFVRNLTTDRETFIIVSAVVRLAQTLGLKVVAEGVEEREDEKLLKKMACDEIQGYLYSRPVSADDFEAWLQSRLSVSRVLKAVG